MRLSVVALFLCSVISCHADVSFEWDWAIHQSGKVWDLATVGEPRVLVAHNVTTAPGVTNQLHNNNVALEAFEDRLFMAWRTAPFHFASNSTEMYVVSSADGGHTWEYEWHVAVGKDLREPYLLAVNGTLYFYFFEAGTNPVAFEPSLLWRSRRFGLADWGEPEQWGHEGEVGWQYHIENETAYVISYSGLHYSTTLGQVNLYFNKSDDGLNWAPVGETEVVYTGGISEVGWAFDLFGNVWGVGRNEDGDNSGWGSRVFFAPADDLAKWEFTQPESDPEIYESPRMFRHGNDLYLIARTDPNGPFWSKDSALAELLPESVHHLLDLGAFSLRPHGSAIWKLAAGRLEKVMDIPGCGDTAFPGIVRTGEHSFVVVNYSNPVDKCEDWPWIQGQLSEDGTLIYWIELEFLERE